MWVVDGDPGVDVGLLCLTAEVSCCIMVLHPRGVVCIKDCQCALSVPKL